MASLPLALLLIFGAVEAAPAKPSNSISLGSSLSPTNKPNSWNSPSGRFAFGFYREGTGFLVAIWLVGKEKNTTIWAANRDDPPVSSSATLQFTNSKLILSEKNEEKEIAKYAHHLASFASMLDSGNFVIYSKDSVVIWESFRFPTDTIVGGQKLMTGVELFSSVSESNHSTGNFRLKMQMDGNLVSYPVNTLDNDENAFWSSNTWGNSKHYLYLNYTGELLLINNTDLSIVKTLFHDSSSSLNKSDVIYRATLNYHGFFQLYSHGFNGSNENNSPLAWSNLENQCDVKGFCEVNSYCTLNDDQPYCLCLPGTERDPDLGYGGCLKTFTEEKCIDGTINQALYNITEMESLRWDDRPYFQASMESKEECRSSCLEDCNCEAALFWGSICQKLRLPLKYVSRYQISESTAFFKVDSRPIKRDNNSNSSSPVLTAITVTSKRVPVLILVISLGCITCSCIALTVSCFFVFKARVVKYRKLLEEGKLLGDLTEELTLQSFSYRELQRATNNFKQELGKGASGTVYMGVLSKGKKLVAIKKLKKMVDEGEREFQAEMRAIGRSHHRNLVRLHGYCMEGSNRLLIYEYMSNGSLADLLFRAETRPDWNERVRIAMDVARGILYLHEECETPIIHCDIKPQNILMDDYWTAKISDFGLAKLLMADQTRTFTVVRGTRGYLAPEWHKNSPISVKADIYSYGIVLLEIVCCRRNLEVNASKPDEMLLSTWAYKCFAAGELHKLVIGEEVERKSLEKMVKLGLWCIQDEPALRPSMKSVVLMLAGVTEIAVPPSPTITSM